jgi:hypothetical protein
MSSEHFIYSKQSAFETWSTPARAIPVENADLQSGREKINLNVTGAERDPYVHVLGAKPVTLALVLPWWTVNVATLLNTCLTDNAITEISAGAVYDHGMLFDDTAFLGAISGQIKHKSDLARNVLGAVPNGLTISAAIKEAAKLTFDMLAKDEAKAGGVWDYDGVTASPEVIALPSYGTLRRPLMFYDAGVVIGGTPALSGTTQKLSIAGGTTYTKVNAIEFAINNNLDADGFGLVADPTVQELGPGNRDIQVTFEMSWSDYATTFYDAARAGTAMAVSLDLVGQVITDAYKYEAHVLAPSVFFDPANLPPISGDKTRKKIQITGAVQKDPITGVGFGLWTRTGEATI